MTKNNKQLSDWIGNQETRTETIHQQALDGFAALMDQDAPASSIVPVGGHWMYFLPTDKQSNLAQDGHSYKGAFLPPVDLPRRMWAGGRLTFDRPLKAGEIVENRQIRRNRLMDYFKQVGVSVRPGVGIGSSCF